MPFKKLSLVALILVFSVFHVLAQTEDLTPLSFAGLLNNDVAVIAPEDTLILIEEDIPFLSTIDWSPDGQRLAYTVSGENGYTLKLTDAQGSEPTTLVEGVSYLPITFSPDGTQIVYGVEPSFEEITEGENGPVYSLPLYAVNVDGTVEPTQIGEIPNFGTGCGGAAVFPMDYFYQQDAGYMGTGLILDYTPLGIVHSMGCNGLGLGILNLETGEDTVFDMSIGNAALSPDKTQALVNVYNRDQMQRIGINVVDLATGEFTSPVEDVMAQPDQLAWGEDGTLYYSTRTLLSEALELPEGMTQLDTGAALVDSVPQYEVALYRVDAETGETTEHYKGSDWAISSIFGTENGVYFNVIPNVQEVFEQIENGEILAEGFGLDRSFVQPTLYFLGHNTDAPVIVFEGITAFTPQK
jgi:hypothetical protein